METKKITFNNVVSLIKNSMAKGYSFDSGYTHIDVFNKDKRLDFIIRQDERLDVYTSNRGYFYISLNNKEQITFNLLIEEVKEYRASQGEKDFLNFMSKEDGQPLDIDDLNDDE